MCSSTRLLDRCRSGIAPTPNPMVTREQNLSVLRGVRPQLRHPGERAGVCVEFESRARTPVLRQDPRHPALSRESTARRALARLSAERRLRKYCTHLLETLVLPIQSLSFCYLPLIGMRLLYSS